LVWEGREGKVCAPLEVVVGAVTIFNEKFYLRLL